MSGIAQNLVGLKLDGYTVVVMTEVCKTDEDGRKTKTLGFFKDSQVATAWAQGQTDKSYNETQEVLIITNGDRYFIFSGQEITVHDDEDAALEVRTAALAKLSDAERAVLGL
ncbi:MAG: hypothetical protein V1853_01850 [bacterium]